MFSTENWSGFFPSIRRLLAKSSIKSSMLIRLISWGIMPSSPGAFPSRIFFLTSTKCSRVNLLSQMFRFRNTLLICAGGGLFQRPFLEFQFIYLRSAASAILLLHSHTPHEVYLLPLGDAFWWLLIYWCYLVNFIACHDNSGIVSMPVQLILLRWWKGLRCRKFVSFY